VEVVSPEPIIVADSQLSLILRRRARFTQPLTVNFLLLPLEVIVRYNLCMLVLCDDIRPPASGEL